MRHLSVWMVGVVVAAIVIGCGPGKELPDEVPKPKDQGPKPHEPSLKIPTVSDPEAKAIVERAIKASTQNEPGRLAKGKISKSVATGSMKLPVNSGSTPVNVPTTRTFVARWPDDVKLTLKRTGEPVGVNTLILRGGLTWSFVNNEPQPNPNPRATEEVVRTDSLAQQFLPLLFPLTEPTAVVFDPHKGVGTPPMDVIRFTMPERPVYQLSFDPRTGYLTGVEYTHLEFDALLHKAWAFSGHKSVDGLMLPTHLEYIQSPERIRTKDIFQDWAVSVWEFPQKLDDTAFDPPK